MKLYVTTTTLQAGNALADFRGQNVSLVTSAMVFKGKLRYEKKTGIYYAKSKAERIDIKLAEVQMIVDTATETRIITNL